MKNENMKALCVLMAICIGVSALMAAVNSFTKPIINEIEIQKVQESLMVVMPDGRHFAEVGTDDLDDAVKEAYVAENGGYVFKVVVTGYASGMTVMCGIDAQGVVTGACCIASGETLEAEKKYGDNFVGMTGDGVDGVDTVSGATLTTKAYKNAVNKAFDAFEKLTGGTHNE